MAGDLTRPHRFIPARAGNTTISTGALMSFSVHPRAGGEHRFGFSGPFGGAGSSPRGRGTQDGARWLGARLRFIPARAGNTALKRESIRLSAVHPRAGGEHSTHASLEVSDFGSSPRWRGTHLAGDAESSPSRFIPARAGNTRVVVERVDAHRFIPARAGNTAANVVLSASEPVHPRAGGEHPGRPPRG